MLGEHLTRALRVPVAHVLDGQLKNLETHRRDVRGKAHDAVVVER
mgnify:CR=1 FL=1